MANEISKETKMSLIVEIEELTKGIITTQYQKYKEGRPQGRFYTTEQSLELPKNRRGDVSYTFDELKQIRDWLKVHIKK